MSIPTIIKALVLSACCALHCCTSLAIAQHNDNGPLQLRQQFAAELQNIRALAFGYTAHCEQGNLKIRASNSATFIIRNSLLCDYKSAGIAPEHRADFLLCSNNPSAMTDRHGNNVPKCVELDYVYTEI